MGLVCACFGLSSPSRKSSPDLSDHNVSFLTTPKVQVMNRNGSNRNSINTKKKMQFSPQEITQHKYEDEKREFTTFREWLLASPPTNGFYSSNGDETLQRNSQKQNKVYPSLVEDCPDYGYDNGRGSFSKKRLLEGGEVDSCSSMDHRVPSLRRSGSKKTKKRVSFRLPEEADIFVYNLKEED